MPVNGGWARCPKCAERFYIPAQGKGLDLISDIPGTSPARRRSGRDDTSQQLLDRLRAKRGEEISDKRLFELDFNDITIFPEPALSPAVCQAIGIALLALPVLVLAIIFFKYDQPAPAPVSTSEFNEMLNNEFNSDLIRADLLQIRSQTINKNRLLTQIDFTGSESRVFKYFASDMVPGVCDVITWLDMESDSPTRGFEVTAVCEGGILEKLKMQVSWTDRTAIINFPGYSKHYQEVDLYPLKPAAANKSAQGG